MSARGLNRSLRGIFAALALLAAMLPMAAYADTAQPPSLVIIAKNAPEDTEISLVTEDGLKEGTKSTGEWEMYFVFYAQDTTSATDVLKVSGGAQSYEVALPVLDRRGYDQILTLDFRSRSISGGKLFLRSVLLVGLRVILTLGIEGLVFLLFGFRKKRSWIVFLAMNLLTQGWLNISLNGGWPLAVYAMNGLIMMEFWIFIAETVGALAFIKEHRRLRRVGFVLTANLLSLILGGLLIVFLPV